MDSLFDYHDLNNLIPFIQDAVNQALLLSSAPVTIQLAHREIDEQSELILKCSVLVVHNENDDQSWVQ